MKSAKQILDLIICIIIAVILAILVRYFLITPTKVMNISMLPTCVENERLIISRISRTFKQMPERGDIITIEAPVKTKYLPSEIDKNNPVAIYEDKNSIIEKFTYNVLEIGKVSYIKRVIGLPGETIKIKNGKVYINDILLEEDYLSENVKTTIKIGEFNNITIPENYVFVMGDNREDSSDSRAFGCIPLDKIESKVLFRFWPLNRFGKV